MVLKFLGNLCGLNDLELTWFEYLSGGLGTIGCCSIANEQYNCVNDTDMIIIYVDNFIILSKTK